MRGLILSAGLGERLRPLTLTRAKPSVEFLNMPMLTFPYHWLNTLGLNDLVFNTHYLPDTIRHASMHVVDPSIALHFTHETAILGSGGGIRGAQMYLQSRNKAETSFAVANGDGVMLFEDQDTIEKMLEFHLKEKALATLLVCPLEGVGSRIPGVWMDRYGEVTNFGKAPEKSYLECFHYASIMLLDQRIWPELPEGPSNILYDILQPRIALGEKVLGFRVDRMHWFETGNVSDYLQATSTCLGWLKDTNNRLGQSLQAILQAHSPAFAERSDFAKCRLIANSSVISTDAKLNGFLVAGADSRIEAGAQLENCVLLSGAVVKSGTSASNQVLG